MKLNNTNGTPFLENKEMRILWGQDKKIALFVRTADLINNMLPLTFYNVLQFVMSMLMYRQMPFVFNYKCNIKLLGKVSYMHL